MTTSLTFKVEFYVETFSSNVHRVLKVYTEGDTLVYTRDFGYTDRSIFEMIEEFISGMREQEPQAGTYVVNISDTNGTYSVTDMNPRIYITDDTI
jgi:hypothetical protein